MNEILDILGAHAINAKVTAHYVLVTNTPLRAIEAALGRLSAAVTIRKLNKNQYAITWRG